MTEPGHYSPAMQAALDELRDGTEEPTTAAVARKHGVDPGNLGRHANKLGIERPHYANLQSRADEYEGTPTDDRSPAEKELARKLQETQARAAADRVVARESKNQIDDLLTEVETLQATLDLVKMVEQHPEPEWLVKPPPEDGTHVGTLLALFSDFHIGEVVNASEMAWYNAYDKDIAEMRIRRYFERLIYLAREHMAGVEVEGIVLACLGDNISGDIHDEFRETNELSNYEAVPYAVKWIKRGIKSLRDEFGRVHVVCTPGNHPRDSKKPRYKKRSAHNADTLIMWLVAGDDDFEGDDRVTFDIPDGISTDFEIYNMRFRAEHGDEARGGSGIQGAMLPIALRTHRLRKQAMEEGRPFDVLLMGHWHQTLPMLNTGFVVNGAGKGYDEFARAKGYSPERAQQTLMLVTPEHGISDIKPVYLQKRSDEGW